MKRTIVLGFLLAIFSAPVAAWNAPIHMAIVEVALEQLTPRQAREINNVAYDLVAEFDQERRLYLMRQFEGTSWLAQLSIVPDLDRDILLDDLFHQYDLEVPEPLAAERARDTSHWHYINRALSTEVLIAQCEFNNGLNLVSVLPLLMESYGAASSDKARALMLSFIVHLVADAHQPMHNLTREFVDPTQPGSGCSHDAGGNDYCVSRRSGIQRCGVNLHQFWDGAARLFDDLEMVDEIAARISLASGDVEMEADLDPQTWSDESFSFGHYVYATTEDRSPDSSYVNESQAISAERLHLAAMRLSRILQSL
jgi:hypothetical protein